MENKSIKSQEQLVFNAVKKVYIDTIEVDGTQVPGSNAKILLDCEEFIVKNATIKDGCTAYNVFEQRGSCKYPMKNLKAENITCDDIALKHNILNVYNLADFATVLVQDSTFNLEVNNSNIIRLANYANAKNVTVHFKNVNWSYENSVGTDFDWAGLIIYQPANTDHALNGDLTELKTWKFIFENCTYNGVKVDSLNMGEHSQVMYMYNINKSGSTESPLDLELDVEFV